MACISQVARTINFTVPVEMAQIGDNMGQHIQLP